MQQQLNEMAIRFFCYFDQKFRGVDNRFMKQDRHIDGLYSLIDSYAKQLEMKEQENLAGNARVARLEAWVEQLVGQSGARLELHD
ncbi:hypothetical protein H7Y63_01465 [Polaromonas sp.]|nr:hypothetical protein [Candidatus Saccharibacteria bacterium]